MKVEIELFKGESQLAAGEYDLRWPIEGGLRQVDGPITDGGAIEVIRHALAEPPMRFSVGINNGFASGSGSFAFGRLIIHVGDDDLILWMCSRGFSVGTDNATNGSLMFSGALAELIAHEYHSRTGGTLPEGLIMSLSGQYWATESRTRFRLWHEPAAAE